MQWKEIKNAVKGELKMQFKGKKNGMKGKKQCYEMWIKNAT